MKKPLLFGIILTVCVVIVTFVFVQAFPPGIVSLWKFDEGSGFVAYDSVDTNDGTIYGPTYTTGIVGDALSFDGVDDYVNVGNDASLTSLTPSAMTIEAWVYNTQLISTTGIDLRTIVAQRPYDQAKGYGLQYGYVAGYDVDDYIVTIAFFGGYQGIVKQDISPNQWHHIAGVFDNNIATIYINGEAQTTTNIGAGYTTSNDDVIIGRHGNWASRYDYHKGIIDEAAIYDRALSAEEIQHHYQDGLHGLGYDVECFPPPTSMVSWWPGDGNEEDFVDENDGYLQGDATYATGRVGQAFSFDGDDDYVTVPNDPIFDLTSQGSWTAWVKLDHHVENLVQHIVTVNQGGVSNARQWALEISMTNKLQMAIRKSDDSSWVSVTDSQDFPLNQWVFVAATYDNASSPSLNIYRDGNPVASNDAYHGDIKTGTGSELRISSDEWEFNGLIDEVEIYNRALLQSEIQAIYNAGSAGKCKIEPNQPPVAHAGPGQMFECTGPTDDTIVSLDGSGSHDPESKPLTYTWTGPFPEGGGTVTGDYPTVTLPLGTSTIILIVNDGQYDSEPDTVDITITVAVDGFLPPLANLVPEGEQPPWPRKAFKQGRTLPLKLQLLCRSMVLSGTDMAPPKIVSLERNGDAINLEMIDMDAGEANDSGSLFRFSDPIWVYNLSTRDLSAGTYVITIEMPDGRLFSGTFMLR